MGKKKPEAPGADSDVKLARLREIVRIMEASTLSALEYEDEDIEVRLARQVPGRGDDDGASTDDP